MLIVYDGWANLRARDVALIILGPVIAIFTSHVFSTTLVMQIELGRRPTRREWFANVRAESRFLLLAVPPPALLGLLTLATVSLQDAVRAVTWMETLSLAFWSGLAAWLGGLRGRPLVLAVLAGLVISGTVVALQVALQPGKALNGGTAAGLTMQAIEEEDSPFVSCHRPNLCLVVLQETAGDGTLPIERRWNRTTPIPLGT